MMKFSNRRKQVLPNRAGFTLVELLIAISILVVIAALVIPSVRIISKDRQSREAARFVGTAFSSAQSQALADGFSGVWIERNPNIADGSTQVFRVKTPRPFSGYGPSATAEVDTSIVGMYTASIPALHSLVPERQLFHVNDFIQFNHSGPLYRVTDVVIDPMNSARTLVTFEANVSDPVPPSGDLPFKIYRRPVKVASTATELPRGYYIDLDLSGHGAEGIQFGGGVNEIVVTFNENGEVDLIYPDGLDAAPTFPNGSIFLLVTEFKVNGVTNLQDKRGLWVSVNRNNGVTSIANMAETAGSLSVIGNSRSIARNGKSAGQ